MADDQTINLNHNAAQCLQQTRSLGSTTIQNICSGKTYEVPWGSADWLLCFFLIAAGLVIVTLFAVMAVGFAAMIWRDVT